MTEEQLMQLAIDKAREGIINGQTPFGAVVVRDGKLVVGGHNTVWRDTDPTCHAEVNAIRYAAKALNNIDLTGCVMYTTCEPCPMCLSAIHWSKIDRVVYGAAIADAAAAGFDELFIPATEMVRLGKSKLKVQFPVLEKECRELFAFWKQTNKSKRY